MYYYSFPLSKVVFISLNAACNPILYFCRMTDFQKWLKNLVQKTNFRRLTLTTSTSAGDETFLPDVPVVASQYELKPFIQCEKL
jgi:hypothetical protein